ncbi:MAG: OmpH family outer membrane protein, partial [Armatimonadota bacterium]
QMQQDGAAALQEIGANFQKQLEALEGEYGGQLSAKVKEVVGQVAKERNIALVFSSQVVVYAAADITPDVIKILQK